MTQNPPAGGELDGGILKIDRPGSGTIGYAWYASTTKAYYAMAVGFAIPLKSSKTNTYAPQSGFGGSTPAQFLTWAAAKLGIAESAVEKQFIKIEYAAWP
jgi:hypothetical protein